MIRVTFVLYLWKREREKKLCLHNFATPEILGDLKFTDTRGILYNYTFHFFFSNTLKEYGSSQQKQRGWCVNFNHCYILENPLAFSALLC